MAIRLLSSENINGNLVVTGQVQGNDLDITTNAQIDANLNVDGTTSLSTTNIAGVLTAGSWMLRTMSNQVEYHVLDNGSLNGPSWKFRYDGATANRYVDFGYKDGNGNYTGGLKLYNNQTISWRGTDIINSSGAWTSTLSLSGTTSQYVRGDGSIADFSNIPGATFSGNVTLGDSSNISMSASSAGQLRVEGNGYTGAIALDGNAMHIYHNSSSRSLVLGTNETARLTIDGSNGDATFTGNGTFDTILNVTAPDNGGSPAMTSRINLHGYDGRGVGIKIKDNVTTSGGGTDREWFVGSGYNQSGFNIGYAADGSQSSYAAQTKLQITTGGYVGIQTTSPTAPLDVFGVRAGRNWAISGRADIRLDSASTSYPADILFGHTGAANETSWTGVYWALSSRATDADNKFYFYRGGGNPTGGSEQVLMTLDPNLRVGIGSTSPDQKLQVNGSIKIANTNNRLVFGTAGGTDRRALEGNTAGTLLQVGEGYTLTQIQSDAQVTGKTTTGEGIMVGGSSGYQIPVAYSVGNGSSTAGAIKIQLPQAMTNTMMMFTVRIYEYNTWEPFDVTICGYNYNPTTTWYNVSAWIDSNPNSDRNFTVRLGYDATATRAVAYIGELNSTWTYPQVWVTQWNGGHSNQGANWHYGYQISFETSAFTGITQTITNTQVNSWSRSGQNLFAVQSLGTGNVGIGTNSPVPKLHLQYTNGSYGTDAASGFINEATTGRGTMRIRSTTDNPAELFFDVNGGVRWDISCRNGASPNLHFYPQAATPGYNAVGAHSFELQQNGNVVVTGNGTSGRLGVHTTNPQGALHVYNGTSERFLVSGDVHVQGSTDLNINGTSRRISFTAGNGTIRTTTANNLILQANSTTVLELKSNIDAHFSGDVYGKSVNNAYSSLYRFGGIYFTWDSDTYGTNFEHSITSTSNGAYGDNMTINSYGKVRINFDSNNNDSGDFRIGHHTTGTANTLFTLDNNGTGTFSGDVVAYSDERLKTNIETLDGTKVYDMRGVSFIKDDKQGSGVIAQELEKIAPELVHEHDEYKTVAYGNITGYLIEAIKDLKAEVEKLKKQIK